MTEQEYSSGSIEDTQAPSCEERLVHLDNVRQLQLEILVILPELS
jgi:ArsR family transcriptional regulator, lead/cadmium/zinc/bismuth-responsive transcriptional repressor